MSYAGRAALLAEHVPGEQQPRTPDLTVGELVLRNTSTRRTKESGAPVHLYDVLDAHGSRVGFGNILKDQDSQTARQHGHVCVTLSETMATGPRLAEVAGALVKKAHEMGVNPVRIVIPADHEPSAEACRLLRPDSAPERVLLDSRPHLAYTYPR